MVVYKMTGGEALLVFFIIILIIILAVAIAWSYRKKKLIFSGVNHVKLYFDENFKNIINEFDLVNRARVKTWKVDMAKRLNIVGKEVDKIKAFRKSFDPRLSKLEKEVKRMETR